MAKKKKKIFFREKLEAMSNAFDGDAMKRGIHILFTALCVVTVIGGGFLGFKYLENYVSKLPVFTSSEVTVSLYDQPGWMSDSLAREILMESFKPIQPDLVKLHHQGEDKKIPEVLVSQLTRNAWVRKVHWIRRSSGSQFVISSEFRQPIAIVKQPESCYLVDGEGYRLPGHYGYDSVKGCGLLEIVDASDNVPSVGKKWDAEDLQAGLKLICLLREAPFKDQILSVDVKNFNGRVDPRLPWMTLNTNRRTIIRWGRPVGDERGLENTAAQKMALLAGTYAKYGHIDFGRTYTDVRRSPYAIDVSVAASGKQESE
jgi:hypothetical protein